MREEWNALTPDWDHRIRRQICNHFTRSRDPRHPATSFVGDWVCAASRF